MGPVKSITHSYTANEYLFWYIEKKDLPKIRHLLDQRPELINCNLTLNYKTTPLHRAVLNGNMDIARVLVEDYKADPDYKTSAGETPLMAAAKRDKP
jgi:ankyrin repeat protein